jgi:hypothetical protein
VATHGEILEKALARLPLDGRREVLGHLREAILWRGWDALDGGLHRKCHCHAGQAVRDIVSVFARHGVGFEEYT